VRLDDFSLGIVGVLIEFVVQFPSAGLSDEKGKQKHRHILMQAPTNHNGVAVKFEAGQAEPPASTVSRPFLF
jgi:hypothetical protein